MHRPDFTPVSGKSLMRTYVPWAEKKYDVMIFGMPQIFHYGNGMGTNPIFMMQAIYAQIIRHKRVLKDNCVIISRSNTYAGLSNLVEKGAAYQIDGKPIRYQAVPAEEFCRNVIRNLQASQIILEKSLSLVDDSVKEYLTVKGSRNIRNKIETLFEETSHRIYISMDEPLLRPFLPLLKKLIELGRNVVIITNRRT